ncbi:hypothetical protein [Variovorax sp. RA8]|uniref:hypothetical protein n=1 Tax=Variovorax sp. (strain JCM 16519 / RA8) TaxID=662548 RepID=UPI0013185AA4|nr:hypothetical protein [Variovorax sp. RA8]VTU44982.1 hypothetical protein RA8P2_00418 [Variovorax sp. RA8]
MRKKIVGVLAAAAVVAVGAVAVGWMGGRVMAKETHERLSTVCPDVVELPEGQRNLVVLLAYECKLADRPVSRGETVACLRQAAASKAASDKFQTPDAQLEQLLRRAGI